MAKEREREMSNREVRMVKRERESERDRERDGKERDD
jgi:hypothetical protein